jgi:hypothetical protein
MNCVFCKNKTSGAHSCGICLKPCHAIPPCASSTEEEGFGASVICGICVQDQKKPMSDSEVENLSDDIEEGPVKKKKKNCYSVDKKLEAVEYAKIRLRQLHVISMSHDREFKNGNHRRLLSENKREFLKKGI